MITFSLVFDRFSVDSSVHSVAAIYFMLFVVVFLLFKSYCFNCVYMRYSINYMRQSRTVVFFTGNSNYLQLKWLPHIWKWAKKNIEITETPHSDKKNLWQKLVTSDWNKWLTVMLACIWIVKCAILLFVWGYRIRMGTYNTIFRAFIVS